MITLSTSDVVSILATAITALLSIATYFYARKLKADDEKRKHSSIRNFDHKTDIFRRLEGLELSRCEHRVKIQNQKEDIERLKDKK